MADFVGAGTGFSRSRKVRVTRDHFLYRIMKSRRHEGVKAGRAT
jgi:hypothetical protein